MITHLSNSDILTARRGIILHQTNCIGAHGGLAGAIFRKWPDALSKYISWCKNAVKPEDLLGKVQLVKIGDGLLLANMFGQVAPSSGLNATVYEVYDENIPKLKTVLGKLFKDDSEAALHIPYKIGCGLAGGDWNTVYKKFFDAFENAEERLVIHEFEP